MNDETIKEIANKIFNFYFVMFVGISVLSTVISISVFSLLNDDDDDDVKPIYCDTFDLTTAGQYKICSKEKEISILKDANCEFKNSKFSCPKETVFILRNKRD